MFHDDDGANSDSDSLFGSPPSSPVRGRSPVLALPSGEDCTQNVGTIALPGSHPYIELPVNTPALSLSSFRHHELSQRPPAQNPLQMQSRPQVEPQVRPLSPRPSSSRAGKKKSSRDNSTAPRPPPPPIHLPDPDAPPPPNFLRNQQALLGLAGLVAGVHPANLSIRRHTRGTNASNPIVVDDILNPPPLGRQTRTPQAPSRMTPPSNEEIVASLIKEKNIFPVLESILKLIAGNVRSNTRPNNSCRDSSQGPAAKRRKVGTVPAGAADWDVPYPFVEGEGPQAYDVDWEKQRGKQLIAQLVSLIKNAARKASMGPYQQHPPLRRPPPRPQQQVQPIKEQQPEPKIMGHYRPITATYGRPGAQIPEVLADQSNTSASGVPAIQPHPYVAHSSFQPFPSSLSDPGSQPPTPFDQLMSSLMDGSTAPSSAGDDGQSTSGWSGDTDTPSETSMPDFNQSTIDNWMSILNAFPDPEYNGGGSSTSTANYDIDSLLSATSTDFSNDFPLMDIEQSITPHDISHTQYDSTMANNNPDFAIDPFLLALSTPTFTSTQSQIDSGVMPPVPALATSPTESATSTIPLLTPNSDVSSSEPGVYSAEQDPMAAANTLLQFASTTTSPSSSKDMMPTRSLSIAGPSSETGQTGGQHPYQLFQQPACTTSTLRAPTTGLIAAPAALTNQQNTPTLRPVPTANKQDILARARERRRQLVGEIDRAKVELWETTIEQGVLAQLVKEKF